MRPSLPRSVGTIAIAVIVVGILALALSGYLSPLYRFTINPLVSAQGWLSTRFMAFYEFFTIPRDAASLRQRNAELESENALLQAQVVELEQQISEAQIAYSLLNFPKDSTETRVVGAHVIGRDTSPFLQYIIIDRGSDSGMRHGMPVITEKGLIGRIVAVTSGASRVQLITDAESAVNVRLQTSQKEAILYGSLTGDLSLEMISQDVEIKTGELILTSGLGGTYPSNLFIGQVVGVRQKEGDLFQSASIQPVVDFSGLKLVLVVTNFKPVDIEPLIPSSNP